VDLIFNFMLNKTKIKFLPRIIYIYKLIRKLIRNATGTMSCLPKKTLQAKNANQHQLAKHYHQLCSPITTPPAKPEQPMCSFTSGSSSHCKSQPQRTTAYQLHIPDRRIQPTSCTSSHFGQLHPH
jgi:hypothetical protein